MIHTTTLLKLSTVIALMLPASTFAMYVDPFDAQAIGGFPFAYNSRHAQDAVEYQNRVYAQRQGRLAPGIPAYVAPTRIFDPDYGNAPGPVVPGPVPSPYRTSTVVYPTRTTVRSPLPGRPLTDEPERAVGGDINPLTGRSVLGRTFSRFIPHPIARAAHALPGTGPASTMAIIALAVAAGFTLWKSRTPREA